MSQPTVTSVTCPSCGNVGTSRRPIRVGTKVRCKGCGQSFEAGDDSVTYEPDLPQPVVPTPPAPIDLRPTTRRKTKKRKDRDEPLFFKTLVIIGWMTITGAVSNFLFWNFRLIEFRMRTKPLPDDFKAKLHEEADAYLVWMVEVASGGMISAIMVGCLLWLAVDIARSLRRMT